MNDVIAVSRSKTFKRIRVGEFKELFKGMVGIAVSSLHAIIGNDISNCWTSIANSTAQCIAAYDYEIKEEKLAWELISNALGKSLILLMVKHEDFFRNNPVQVLLDDIGNYLDTNDLTLTHDFLDSPANSRIFKAICSCIHCFLKDNGLEEIELSLIERQFSPLFIYSLKDEWRERRAYYSPLAHFFESKFTKASINESEWERYNAWLLCQADERVFFDKFTLQQIYIPLNCWYERRIGRREADAGTKERDIKTRLVQRKGSAESGTDVVDIYDRVVDQADTLILNWLAETSRDDALRIISGGPGSGKSTFAKILAAKLSTSYKTIFIPLYLFNMAGDIETGIGKYLKQSKFFTNNPCSDNDKIVIIFDGLDEFAKMGESCFKIAFSFISELKSYITRSNIISDRLRVIVTAREIIVQSQKNLFEQGKEVLNILPYYIKDDMRYAYTDPKSLLREDKRNLWWQKYGTLTQNKYSYYPEELRQKHIDELSSVPLLNYLIALIYQYGEISFTAKANLNDIYDALILAVYERAWGFIKHSSLSSLSYADFCTLLEDISLCVWHGTGTSGRTVTASTIAKHCERTGQEHIFEAFQEGAKSGVTNLLTAFYFREYEGAHAAEKTFEFTHKSFCEYLFARKIVKVLSNSYEMRCKATSPYDCLGRWHEICGPNPIDSDCFIFLCNEVYKHDLDTVTKWQDFLIEIIEFILTKGLPVHEYTHSNFVEICRQVRNSEETLLAALNACARTTGRVSRITWPDSYAAGNWINKLRGQRTGRDMFALNCLSFLSFDHCEMQMIDMYRADLSFSSLRGVNLASAILREASFEGSQLQEAILHGAQLQGANFFCANLHGANLENALAATAKFKMSNLTATNLAGTSISSTDTDTFSKEYFKKCIK